MALLAVCASAPGTPALADAGPISFAPCANNNDYACGHLTVPLDPSGGTPGVITLAIRRHRAPVGSEKTAVIALAGGPGQAALPFAEEFATVLGPIVSTRDLIVFDQRGIGLSHALSCKGSERRLLSPAPGPAITACANEIGPSRAFYTTSDSVADIEAIRQAGGYEKLVLYGTSYGTKVAELYAQEYPGHVEALVLDSVVPPNGPDPLDRATFAAIPRILHQLCAARACAGITSHPVADLARVRVRIARRALYGRWIDGHGHRHRVAISAGDLLETLLDGDLEPTLRSEFPAAIHSAAGGDTASLARLLERTAGSEEASEQEAPGERFDQPLYYATTCEEDAFGWSRAASPRRRLAEATAQIQTLPASLLAPFARTDVLGISDIPACSFWPYTTAAPAPDYAPFPAVPTLILSGADDLRTPTANAREVAAQIPGSHLLVVPNVGHSVLGSDLSGCSNDALQALFAAKPVRPCPAAAAPSILRPTPLAPARLAAVAPARGNHGLPGQTLEAVLLSLSDADRELELQAFGALASGELEALSSLRIGGLRAGWAQTVHNKLILHDYTYVPGVSVSGQLAAGGGVLSVGGSAAAAGTVALARASLSGALGGIAVHTEGTRVQGGAASSLALSRLRLSGLR